MGKTTIAQLLAQRYPNGLYHPFDIDVSGDLWIETGQAAAESGMTVVFDHVDGPDHADDVQVGMIPYPVIKVLLWDGLDKLLDRNADRGLLDPLAMHPETLIRRIHEVLRDEVSRAGDWIAIEVGSKPPQAVLEEIMAKI